MEKRMKHRFRKVMIYFTVLSVLLTGTLWSVPANALGLFDLSSGIISKPVNEYTAEIAPGVLEKHYSYEDLDGKITEAFVVEVDMKNPYVSVEAGTPNDGSEFAMQSVRKQAEYVSVNNHNVVAAVNCDYFNMATGEPFGIIYKDGQPVKTQNFPDWRFFGITKDGKAVIGDPAYLESTKNDLKEALGGQAILVKDGRPYELPVFNPGRNPRTAVGIKADGNVFFITVDGRQASYSNGVTAASLAQLMIDLGAVTALDLDGGGSTTFVSRKPGNSLLQVVNSPSDGAERNVANSWLIVSTAKPDHIFDSAFIEPNDNLYTPGSIIQFTAKGMDKTLSYAPLPTSGLSWELSDYSFGTINDNGRFVSSGRRGELQVILKYKGKEVGSAWIGIQNPDEFKFENSQLTICSGQVRTLNITGKYNKKQINIKPDDLIWQVPEALGTLDEKGQFHASQNPVSGTITATLKGSSLSAKLDVSVGQLPQTITGFENGLDNWVTSTVGRGERSSIKSASSANEPVRFGNKSLKIDFDFTAAQTASTLGVYSGPGIGVPIPGNPTALGMWVYATPESNGYWLRAAVNDSSGNSAMLNLTQGNSGINWTGWKYIEAPIPSGLTGTIYMHPDQAVRIMSTNSGVTGPMTKGSIYIDDIRAVYGVEDEDLKAPIIESINVDGKTYSTSTVDIFACVNDNEKDLYKTGINWDKVKIFVDNTDYTKSKGHFAYDMDGYISLTGLSWSKGTHKVTISAQDNSGNETIKTAAFKIQY